RRNDDRRKLHDRDSRHFAIRCRSLKNPSHGSRFRKSSRSRKLATVKWSPRSKHAVDVARNCVRDPAADLSATAMQFLLVWPCLDSCALKGSAAATLSDGTYR